MNMCECKEVWCVGLGQVGGSLHEDGVNCLNILKRGGIEKKGVVTKKKLGVGALTH